MSMLVIGSVARDTIHNPSGTFPMILGGSAVFASIAASHFTRASLVGVVGSDFPESEVNLLKKCGIDTTGLETVEGKTFHWEGRYSDDLSSRTSIATDLNVFASFRPKIPSALRNTPFVMLGNIDPALQCTVVDQLEKPRLVIADTMNYWISSKPGELADMLKRVDLLVVNEEESKQLAGSGNVFKAAKALLAMGPSYLIIKRGEYGALLFHGGEIFSAPAFPCETVLDPTGAGDTFAGGFLGYLAKENKIDATTMRRAVIYGSTLASFCVEGMGVERLVRVTPTDLATRFSGFAKLAHFATDSEVRALGGVSASV